MAFAHWYGLTRIVRIPDRRFPAGLSRGSRPVSDYGHYGWEEQGLGQVHAGEVGQATHRPCEKKSPALLPAAKRKKTLASTGKTNSSWPMIMSAISVVAALGRLLLAFLATGGGIKTRALYTNNEQFVVGFCRPLILNGIPDFAENHVICCHALILVTQPTIPLRLRGRPKRT